MRDLFAWSIPLGRMFGVLVRVHWLFPAVVIALILRTVFHQGAAPGIWRDASWEMAILFSSVLLHEFGHCFGARWVDGDAQEVLLWPLGGLAYVDVPNTPRANFIAVAAGPAVNLLLCLFAALGLLYWQLQPPWNPLWPPFYLDEPGKIDLYTWQGVPKTIADFWPVLLARTFSINWVHFLFNALLVGFPMDSGRMFQCLLWPYYGYRQATMAAVVAGFAMAAMIFVVAVFANEVLLFCLALFIYVSCRQQMILLEASGDEALFGYDYGQDEVGEEVAPPLPRRRPNFIKRWLQRRAARKLQREQEQREAEERRMDELLEKVQRNGLQALSEEERRFLKRVSDRYRNRQ